jgi:hypothetical protein
MKPLPSEIGRSGLLCALAAAILLALAPGAAPAAAAAPGAFTAPDDAAVPALIKSLRGCLAKLTPADRQVLTLRSGLGGKPAELTAAIAAATSSTPAATSTALVTAIRRLEGQRRAGACQTQTTAAKKAASPARTTTKKAAAATSAPVDTSIGALGIIAPVLLIAAFGAGISLELRRQRRPPSAEV